jgi:exodeoxyribonuclease-3
MKIATWNVNGIRARQVEVRAWLARERPDVVCLQEIKAAPEQIPAELADLADYWCYWHGAKGYSGVGLLVSKALAPARPNFSHPPFDHETRIVIAEIAPRAPGQALSVASVYVPNGGKDLDAKMRFLEGLAAYADAFRATGASLVLCGDLNVARTEIDVHLKERNPRVIGQLPEERALIERLISHGLVDVARRLEPNNDQLFTWWPPWRNMRQRNLGWRIDFVLASEALAARLVSAVSHREIGTSDHAPVVVQFSD